MFLQNTMANNNPYDTTTQNQDEISLFLQQILLRSSSSSSSHSHLVVPTVNKENETGRVVLPEPITGSSGGWIPANVSSSSYVGTFDNDPDEYDCESEEGVEDLALKQTPQRNSSKRSRAAEVHNLSEKRRRSRINEKMKALQNLIPNSNKTDKASMLDEAIEYLKQLQLQVQMLTLRNGLSLYPICLPGIPPPDQIPQTRVDVCERSILNTEKAVSMEPDISADTLLSLQKNCPEQVPVADFSTMIGPKTTFELGSSFLSHFEPIQFSRSSSCVSRNEVLSCHQLNNEWCPTSLTAGPFDTTRSSLKENTMGACLAGGDCLGGTDKLPNLLNNTIFLSQLKNSDNGGRHPSDDIKTESGEF